VITTKYQPLNGWTRQRIIEQIYAKNNGTRAARVVSDSTDGSSVCYYRTPDGNACAVGCFVPDDHLGCRFQGGVTALLRKYEDLRTLMPLDVNALHQLQELHDQHRDHLDGDVRVKLEYWILTNVAEDTL
jgi:hypothetical protein